MKEDTVARGGDNISIEGASGALARAITDVRSRTLRVLVYYYYYY
jgi:hypothetical protein